MNDKWIDNDILEAFLGRLPSKFEVIGVAGHTFTVGISYGGRTFLAEVTERYELMEAIA